MTDALHDIFIQEAEENLMILENGIIRIEENPEDDNTINEAFRAIHSIKGGAGLAGFSEIKDFSHVLEDLFEYMRNGTLKIQERHVSIILKALDILRLMVSNIKNDLDSKSGVDTSETVEEIEAAIRDAEKGSKERKIDKTRNWFHICLCFYPELFQTGIDPLMFLNDLENAGTILFVHADTGGFPDEMDFNPETLYLSWQLFYETEKSEKELLDIFCFVIDESNIAITNLKDISADSEELKKFSIAGRHISDFIPGIAAKKSIEYSKDSAVIPASTQSLDTASGSYIRVQTDKLENIFNTVSELLISQARLNMLTEENEDLIPDSFGTVTDSLKNITNLLQEQVTSLRMMSLSSTFDRFKRVVRDIASDRGKKVKLLIEGQDTELDKNMIEKLNDPLKHLVRNCIDHGIETESEREAKGKTPEGHLKLSAYLESGKVVIEVADDGKGIDREKILQKAEERGVINTETRLSDGEILNLIFHPGLSTAAEITDLSGRGVGMDVVKNSINELHGNIDISSEKNRGTSFKLYLPLTLAILDGMLVTVGREKYIIPTLAILEIFRPEAFHLKTISSIEEVVYFRGEYIPLIRLHKILDVADAIHEPMEGELIVILTGGVRAAILVDNVLEQYQIVLKSLQRNYRRVENISSATILGNGDVALIIDPQSLVQNRVKASNAQKV